MLSSLLLPLPDTVEYPRFITLLASQQYLQLSFSFSSASSSPILCCRMPSPPVVAESKKWSFPGPASSKCRVGEASFLPSGPLGQAPKWAAIYFYLLPCPSHPWPRPTERKRHGYDEADTKLACLIGAITTREA